MKKTDLSPLSASGTSMLVGGLLALMHSLFSDTWNPLPIQAGELGPFMKMTFLIIAISNILCYNLYAFMLKRFTATFLSFIGLLSPIFASLHGWLFLHEPLSWTIFLSTAILLAGLWILYAEELKQGYITRSTKLKEA
jgi:drug/metabolite transporter (DMT)-like permease